MPNQSKMPLPKAQKAPNAPSNQTTEESSVQKRIQVWREKKKTDEPGVRFTASQHPENEKTFCIEEKVHSSIDSKIYSKSDVIASLFATLSGSGSGAYSAQFVSEASAAMINNLNEDAATSAMNAFQGGMLSMNPQDTIEGQLCAKLMVLHSKSMLFMSRANTTNTQKLVDQNLNNATKCMRLHNETIEALNRYRRKGEQRVKVVHQYVQVNEGGQAVVAGDVTRGGDKQKK